MTQKAWNLQYRESNVVKQCYSCDHYQRVPHGWCNEIGMVADSYHTCINYSGASHAAFMGKQGTKGT